MIRRYSHPDAGPCWLAQDVATLIGGHLDAVTVALRRVPGGLVRIEPRDRPAVTVRGLAHIVGRMRPGAKRALALIDLIADATGPAYTVASRLTPVGPWMTSELSQIGRLAAAAHRERYGSDPEQVREGDRLVAVYRGADVRMIDDAARQVRARRAA